MIDISNKIKANDEDWFVAGFIARLRYRLYISKQPVQPFFSFEKKFYKSLSLNKSCAHKFITMSPTEMENIVDSTIFKKYRLFFLLCLPKDIRHSKAFGFHTYREFKNLPRDTCGISIDDLSEQVRERAIKLFDYDYFSKKSDNSLGIPNWGAYELAKRTMPEACPFCNTQSNKLIIIDGQEKARPALDHYYCKSKYPFFRVSLRNLISSCTTCNSVFKQEKDFINTPHLSPYEGTLIENYSFKILPVSTSVVDIWNDISAGNRITKKDFIITLEPIFSDLRMDNNLNTFQISAQHDATKAQNINFISKLAKTTKPQLEQLVDILNASSLEECARMHLEIPEKDKISDIVFGAMRYRMYEDYIAD